jgi:hypothetical protein
MNIWITHFVSNFISPGSHCCDSAVFNEATQFIGLALIGEDILFRFIIEYIVA